jgi:hypothetical protein
MFGISIYFVSMLWVKNILIHINETFWPRKSKRRNLQISLFSLSSRISVLKYHFMKYINKNSLYEQ